MSILTGPRLAGRVALVTGAARGQGRSHCVRLAEEGADIVALDLCGPVEGVIYPPATTEDLDETVRLVEKLDRRITAHRVDLRDLDATTAAVDQGVAELGRLDIIAANAGISTPGHPLHEVPPAEWHAIVDVNLTGVWHTLRAGVPHVIAGGRGGSVVLTSSAAGVVGYPNIGPYVAAKHGVVGLMRSLANEVAAQGIRVNAVLPGQVDSPMMINEASFRLFEPFNPAPTRESFEAASMSAHALPIPYVGEVDVSNAVVFLSSDEGRYITGAALPVDGGIQNKR